jgi:hypothetical protein
MVERGHVGGGEAEQEPVEQRVVQAPSFHAEAAVPVVAAMPAAAEVLERQRIMRRLEEGLANRPCPAAGFLPEAGDGNRDRHQREDDYH